MSNIIITGIEGDTVIVDWGTIWCRREISMGATKGECNETKPLEGADGEPLNVAEGDGECRNLLIFNLEIDVDHAGRAIVIWSGSTTDYKGHTLLRGWKSCSSAPVVAALLAEKSMRTPCTATYRELHLI